MNHKTISIALVIAILSVCTSINSISQTKSAKKFTVGDLRKLTWIEGSWRGTGDGGKPFFERYHFENKSTLLTETFAQDETLTKVTETTRFVLRDGQFANDGNDWRWRASAIDKNSIEFVPLEKAKNSFTWRRETKDSWTAILTWPADGAKPAGRRVFKMERWPQVPKRSEKSRVEAVARP